MQKKQIFLWALYDFANSIVFVNFLLYFSQWLVLDWWLSDLGYNAIFAISAILLFFTAPVLATYTDKFWKLKKFLNWSTLGVFLFYGLAAGSALWSFPIYLTAVFFLFAQYCYQLSFVFYNPMIADISDKPHRWRVSGIGQFANALGQVVGLAIFLPLSEDLLAPLLPAVWVFFLLALPMMIFFKDTAKTVTTGIKKIERNHFYKKLIPFFSVSLAAPLLVAFFFYNDALVTVTNNLSIYLENVFEIPNNQKSIILMLIVLMNAVGALLSGWIGDKIGIKKTLIGVLIAWIIALPIVAITASIPLFMILSAILGILIGAMRAVSRAYMSMLVAKEDLWYGFSFYTIFERFAAIIWPLTWGGIIAIGGVNSGSYRIAMVSMTAFVVVWLLLIIFWKRKTNTTIER